MEATEPALHALAWPALIGLLLFVVALLLVLARLLGAGGEPTGGGHVGGEPAGGAGAPARGASAQPDRGELLALIAAGRKLEAIKLHRAATGATLAQAKAEVDALEREGVLPPAHAPTPGPAAPVRPEDDPALVDFVRANRLIEAIQRYRELTGASLAAAKDAVVRLRDRGV